MYLGNGKALKTRSPAALLSQVLSEPILDQAYQWLCQQRKDYSHNSDLWDFMLHWPQRKPEFIQQVQSGHYRFSPVQRYHINGETLSCWAAQDALLLKAMTLVLQDYLAPQLPACCLHLAGTGGVKQAIRLVDAQLQPGQFVMRTDVQSFYDSVDHVPLYQTLCQLVPDRSLCRLVWQSLRYLVVFEGAYRDINKGLSRSHPMSPLLGALALLPMDRALQQLPVFYLRYMDDWVIIANSRRGLRRAIQIMHQQLNQLGFTLHPDKTSIGRMEQGFDFLGYNFSEHSLQLATVAQQRLGERILRLYEHTASIERIGDYLHRWRSSVKGGGDLFQAVEVEWVIDTYLLDLGLSLELFASG